MYVFQSEQAIKLRFWLNWYLSRRTWPQSTGLSCGVQY